MTINNNFKSRPERLKFIHLLYFSLSRLDLKFLFIVTEAYYESGLYVDLELTLEALGGGGQIDPPSIFLALNFCSLTDCQKLWHNCSLFVNTSFDIN